MQIEFKNKILALDVPVIMGIVNVTPDSFSDGGKFCTPDQALRHVLALVEAGADMIDIGGESTRPGAAEVSLQMELDRVMPIIETVRKHSEIPISIDTSKPEVMRAAVNSGVDMINDVRALSLPGALEAAIELAVPVCLMHMQGQPDSMQLNPVYEDVCLAVKNFFQDKISRYCEAGLTQDRIILDPGFGFGKTLTHNLVLLRNLALFRDLGCPLLVGVSRKSMIGTVTGKPVAERLYGSIAAATIAVLNGAHILRVHDVAETLDAIKIATAVVSQQA